MIRSITDVLREAYNKKHPFWTETTSNSAMRDRVYNWLGLRISDWLSTQHPNADPLPYGPTELIDAILEERAFVNCGELEPQDQEAISKMVQKAYDDILDTIGGKSGLVNLFKH